MLTIDGSHGEGGGQLVRLAMGLSALTGKSLQINKIRAGRSKSGLAAQHLCAVKGVAQLSGGTLEGDKKGSQTLTFHPGQGGDPKIHLKVGTAGSVTLVLQAALPVAMAAAGYLRNEHIAFQPDPQRVRLVVEGGTDVRWSPPVTYWDRVFLDRLRSAGLHADLRVVRRGYFPRGGGRVELEIAAADRPMKALQLESPGQEQVHVSGLAYSGGLPDQVCDRMASSARKIIVNQGQQVLEIKMNRMESPSPGGGLVLWAVEGRGNEKKGCGYAIGHSELAAKGRRSEDIGKVCAENIAREISAGSEIDPYCADQLLVYLALTGGGSYLTRKVTEHTRTAGWLIEQFLPIRFEERPKGQLHRLLMEKR